MRDNAQRNSIEAAVPEANDVCEIRLTPEQLTAAKPDVDLASGAVVEFRGVVRALEKEEEIRGIEYEAHIEMAEHQLRAIAEEAAHRFGLTKIVLHHRMGFVAAGEPSLYLAVRSGHRAAAFDGSKWIVDELKQRVPIWKRPVYLSSRK